MIEPMNEIEMTDSPLFEGERIYLSAPYPEQDAEIVSGWTHDPELKRMTEAEPSRPLSPDEVEKKIESALKKDDDTRFEFMIRKQSDDRLVGSARIFGILWPHRCGRLEMLIGDASDRDQGYGSEALAILLRFAFHELNLYRLAAAAFAHNHKALRWLEQSGFIIEVRQREAIERDGERWDLLQLALLQPEWKASWDSGENA